LGLPAADTTVTALTASTRGFAAAGQYGGTGQQEVVVWTLGAGNTWTRPHVGGITGSGTGRTHEITALEATGSAVTGIGPVAPAVNRQAVVFTLRTH
jgi:PPE-repeat protein